MAEAITYRAEMTGLSDRDRTLLRSLLAVSQPRTGIFWDDQANRPRVHFIDIDQPAGNELWQSLSDAERREAAIVLSQTQPAEGTRWLPKPVRSAALLSLLERMQVSAKIASATPVAKAEPRARVETPMVEPRLLEFLEGSGSHVAQVLQSAHWPDIVLAAGNKYAMRTAPIEDYEQGFAGSLEVTRMAKYTGGPLPDDQRIDLSTLRWLALLNAPLSEIAHRLPNPARAHLRGLPDFAELPHSLLHLRMTAWLTQHTSSPQEIAAGTDIDDETVQRFLGACAALGLLQEVAAEAPPVLAPAPPPPVAQPQYITANGAASGSLLERLRAARAIGTAV